MSSSNQMRQALTNDITYAKCEDIKSISDERLIAHIGDAPLHALFDITRSLRFLLET